MPRASSKHSYYAVRVGRTPGIYLSWADCEPQVKGFASAVYKKLNTEAEALEFIDAKHGSARSSASRDLAPLASTSRAHQPRTVAAASSTTGDESNSDIVYCDGACRGNGRPGSIAGIGVWWGHGDPRNISERCPGDQTNNRAELIAIVRILETAPRLTRRLLIKTDSYYSIQCVTSWIFKWMRNGFLTADGKPVKNLALIKYLAALLHARRKTLQTVEFKHVRGHVGIEGNEAADQLANLGAGMPVVPERDWERLEKEVLQNLKAAKPIDADGDLKMYADGLLNDDELAALADSSIRNCTLPVREQRRQHSEDARGAIRSFPFVSLVPSEASLPRGNAYGSSGVGLGDRTTAMHSSYNSHSGSSSDLAAIGAFGPRSASFKQPVSKQEMEILASRLLGEGELSTLGKDGVFDSDF